MLLISSKTDSHRCICSRNIKNQKNTEKYKGCTVYREGRGSLLARSPFCINDFQGVFRPKRVLSPLEEENNLAPPCPWRKLECQLPNAQMSHYKHNSNRSTKIYVYNIYRWIHIDEYIRTCLDG